MWFSRILLVLVVCSVVVIAVTIFTRGTRRDNQEAEQTTKALPSLPHIPAHFLPVIKIGYGVIKHSTFGLEQFGILFKTYGSMESAILVSKKDISLLEVVQKFIEQNVNNDRGSRHEYINRMFAIEQDLNGVRLVLFEGSLSCSARLHGFSGKEICLSAGDAFAMLMISLTKARHDMPIFANKRLFSKKYLESLQAQQI